MFSHENKNLLEFVPLVRTHCIHNGLDDHLLVNIISKTMLLFDASFVLSL